MKNILKLLVPIAIMIVSVVCSISLWNMPVYNGTYTAKYNDEFASQYNFEEENEVYITFSGDTFSLRNEKFTMFAHGFFQYAKDGSMLNWESGYECLRMRGFYSSHSNGGDFVFKRNSVFSISCVSSDLLNIENNTGTYYCWSAIWLQIFLIFVFVVSVVALIFICKNNIRKQPRKE